MPAKLPVSFAHTISVSNNARPNTNDHDESIAANQRTDQNNPTNTINPPISPDFSHRANNTNKSDNVN